MTILVIAEHDNFRLNSSTLNVISAAQLLKQEIHVLIAGYQSDAVILEAQKLEQVKLCLHADNPIYQHFLAENIAELIYNLATDYEYILVAATTFGKNILPRVAAKLNVDQVSDVIEIISNDTFVRPIYAGNALATVQSSYNKKLLTIRKSAFPACKLDNNCPLKIIDFDVDPQLSKFISLKQAEMAELPPLENAKIIISGGRGLQSKENFKLIEQLAQELQAAVGATRAAVDAGFIANEFQIGQTGKIVAPDLYIAIGLSGAIQHVAGMKDSKVIIAINKDPDAPIFKIADYGLVADLFNVVPELISKLSSDKDK